MRYRTDGGRGSGQRERIFGRNKRGADDFALKVEHDKRGTVFVDPAEGKTRFGEYAQLWLAQRVLAEGTVATYESVLRIHILPAFGGKHLATVWRRDIKDLLTRMRHRGLGASRITRPTW
ncbi:hypothetical protein J5X84_41500 [Streptosporangiaceae bacterium NEAU-GS5]|nr:hypothetical protein [Streptosporangiaceae bacterium NEAU-GS5]